MTSTARVAIGGGLAVGITLLAVVLWTRGPSDAAVRRTVVTTIQEEAPASFLVTGTMDLTVTVRVDSSQYLTPTWLTSLLKTAQSSGLALVEGGAETKVRVPGTASYGFDVRALKPPMITVEENGIVGVDLPALTVHSVEPELRRLEVRSQTSGWLHVLPSDVPDAVRTQALGGAQEAFRAQAQRHLDTATQPRVNTARALKAMLTPPLKAAGVDAPQFRIRVGEALVLQPETEGERRERNR